MQRMLIRSLRRASLGRVRSVLMPSKAPATSHGMEFRKDFLETIRYSIEGNVVFSIFHIDPEQEYLTPNHCNTRSEIEEEYRKLPSVVSSSFAGSNEVVYTSLLPIQNSFLQQLPEFV